MRTPTIAEPPEDPGVEEGILSLPGQRQHGDAVRGRNRRAEGRGAGRERDHRPYAVELRTEATPHDRGADDRLERVSDRDPRRDGYRGIARHVRDERAGGNRGPVPHPEDEGAASAMPEGAQTGVITPWATSRLIPTLAAPTYEPQTKTKSPAAIRRPRCIA